MTAATPDKLAASIDGRRVSRPGRLSTEQPGTTPEDAVPGNPYTIVPRIPPKRTLADLERDLARWRANRRGAIRLCGVLGYREYERCLVQAISERKGEGA